MNTVNTMRIGILGGTFDPIHLGHIQPAKQVIKKYKLDKLLIIPAHKPPHKASTNATTEQRVKMVELVCDQENSFILDTREIERSTLSYTVDTIKELKIDYPTSQLFFIMGMDSLLNFTQWYMWESILQSCNLIVNTRPGYELSSLNNDTKKLLNKYKASANKEINGPLNHSYFVQKKTKSDNLKITTGNIYINHCDELNISSTIIRKNLALNVNCDQWLTKAVLKFINANHLYQ